MEHDVTPGTADLRELSPAVDHFWLWLSVRDGPGHRSTADIIRKDVDKYFGGKGEYGNEGVVEATFDLGRVAEQHVPQCFSSCVEDLELSSRGPFVINP